MSKLNVGDIVPEFTFRTPFKTGCTFKETLSQVQGKTGVIFHRFYGCPLSRYDIYEYASVYQDILSKSGQLLVVLQSDPTVISSDIHQDTLPFEIICDPDQILYRKFDVPSVEVMPGDDDLPVVEKTKKAAAAGFTLGEKEGNPFQLPAVFIMDRSGQLTYVHYSTSFVDVPDGEGLRKLFD